MDIVDKLAEVFSREELVEMTQELDYYKISNQTSLRELVDIVRRKLLRKERDNYSELLTQFGNLILQESGFIEIKDFQIPSCFGHVSDQDPECNHCILYEKCLEELLDALPDCYGILYDDCDCMVRETCQQTLRKGVAEADLEVYIFHDSPLAANTLAALARYRNYYHSWPHKMIMSQYHRAFTLRIRDCSVQRHDETTPLIWEDSLYFYIQEKGSIPTERIPISEVERKSVK